jgi:hypothetical protein
MGYPAYAPYKNPKFPPPPKTEEEKEREEFVTDKYSGPISQDFEDIKRRMRDDSFK